MDETYFSIHKPKQIDENGLIYSLILNVVNSYTNSTDFFLKRNRGRKFQMEQTP